MSDLIDRAAAIEALEEKYFSFGLYREQRAASQCIDVIKHLPSAQPDIIRCLNCIHRRKGSNGYYCGYEFDRCDPYEMTRRADDPEYFCADAERNQE